MRYKGWVIYPTDDYYVRILSENKDELDKHFRTAVDDWQVVEKFYDKRLSYPIADSLNVPIPNTQYINSYDAIDTIHEETRYPCIIKPAIMKDFYDKLKVKAILCKSPEELKQNLNRTSQQVPLEYLMVQELIPGFIDTQYSVGILFDGWNIVNYITAKRKRQHPLFFGHATTYAETVDIPVLKEYATMILKEVGYKGICEVEFMYDKRDGKYKFLEVNPRLWKWHLLAHQSNVPILESSYKLLTEGSHCATENFQESAWIDIVTDVKARFDLLRKGIIPKDDTRPTISAVYNKDDVKPFVMQLLYLPCFALYSNRNCGV
jgi:predicted ATP-grasp superfamily ATP-dependent carboligase